MTRLDIQTRLQNHFQNPVYYTSIDINDSVQDGVDEVCAFSGCIYKSASIPFQKDLTYYNINESLSDYIGLVGIFNLTTRRWLLPTSIRKLDQVRVDWDSAYGTPYYFCPISYRYFAIYKKPHVANYGNMVVFYVAAAPQLDDTVQIPIPDDHLTALESYNIRDLWEQNQEFGKAAEYMETYVNNLEGLRVYIKNKRNQDRQQGLR